MNDLPENAKVYLCIGRFYWAKVSSISTSPKETILY